MNFTDWVFYELFLLTHLKLTLSPGWWDSSAGKGDCCQAWWPESIPRTQRVEGGYGLPQVAFWPPHVHCGMITSTHTSTRIPPHPHNTDKSINVIKKTKLSKCRKANKLPKSYQNRNTMERVYIACLALCVCVLEHVLCVCCSVCVFKRTMRITHE